MKKLLLLLLIVVFSMGCSLNEYAVKKSIQSGASIGIIAWDLSDSDASKNITYLVARNFLAEGYSVKALNTIGSKLTYPFLRNLFEGEMELKFKTKIESLLKYTVETETPFEREGQIKKELEEIKGIIGMDYLVVLYKKNKTYSVVGIDIGNYEIVYSHQYEYTPFPIISQIGDFFIPFSEQRKISSIIKEQFIKTIQEVGSKEEYSPW